jgi:preprotein translocase subunit SecA
MVTKAIERAQNTVEGRNAEIRKDVLKYDEVMNEQRKVIYARRVQILDAENLYDYTLGLVDAAAQALVLRACPSEYKEEWDLHRLVLETTQYWPSELNVEDLEGFATLDELVEAVQADGSASYERHCAQLPGGEETARSLERDVMLQIVDVRWREHLSEMDYLREGIGLRAVANQDPLVAWQREGYSMFERLLDSIDDDYLKYITHLEAVPSEQAQLQDLSRARYEAQEDPQTPRSLASMLDEGPTDAEPEPAAMTPIVKPANEKIGRNEPCWCGSGKKFKFCHGKA